LGADLVGGWLVEVGEQVAGVVPGGAGRVRVTGGVVAGAQKGEGAGFGVAVAQRSDQLEGSLVAGDGLGRLAALQVGVAQT
jgi:hypothetical protein